uniref:Endoplasmic reticulum junction formation protein lunapark n=1 Tax=Panagrellus redivivus TaxID=6233 RepID=A0A7E5A0Y9_PANRE
MGSAFSRATEPKHELERISEEVKQINECIRGLDEQQTFAVKLTLVSIGIGVISIAIGFLSQRPDINPIVVCVIALLVLLILYYFFLSVVRRIYRYRTNKQYTLKEVLLKKREEILKTVKEKESYNTARELIMKYGNEEDLKAVDLVNKLTTPAPPPPVKVSPPNGSVLRPGAPQEKPQELKQRGPPITPLNNMPPPGINGGAQIPPGMMTPVPGFRTPTIRPLPAITRTPIDKVLDFFIGDGPSYRYALICSNCNAHNGLALPEEFERIAYHCARCNHFNSRRKGSNTLPIRPPMTTSALPSRSASVASRASALEADVDAKVPPSQETPKMPKPDATAEPR